MFNSLLKLINKKNSMIQQGSEEKTSSTANSHKASSSVLAVSEDQDELVLKTHSVSKEETTDIYGDAEPEVMEKESLKEVSSLPLIETHEISSQTSAITDAPNEWEDQHQIVLAMLQPMLPLSIMPDYDRESDSSRDSKALDQEVLAEIPSTASIHLAKEGKTDNDAEIETKEERGHVKSASASSEISTSVISISDHRSIPTGPLNLTVSTASVSNGRSDTKGHRSRDRSSERHSDAESEGIVVSKKTILKRSTRRTKNMRTTPRKTTVRRRKKNGHKRVVRRKVKSAKRTRKYRSARRTTRRSSAKSSTPKMTAVRKTRSPVKKQRTKKSARKTKKIPQLLSKRPAVSTSMGRSPTVKATRFSTRVTKRSSGNPKSRSSRK